MVGGPPTSSRPRPALTVDVAVLRGARDGLEVLLVRRGRPPFAGRWALPGGFVEPDEPLAAAAARELREETGIAVAPGALRQVGAFGDPGRDPRGWTVTVLFTAFAAAPPAREQARAQARAGDDAAAVGWHPAQSPPPLAFDHDLLLKCALEVSLGQDGPAGRSGRSRPSD